METTLPTGKTLKVLVEVLFSWKWREPIVFLSRLLQHLIGLIRAFGLITVVQCFHFQIIDCASMNKVQTISVHRAAQMFAHYHIAFYSLEIQLETSKQNALTKLSVQVIHSHRVTVHFRSSKFYLSSSFNTSKNICLYIYLPFNLVNSSTNKERAFIKWMGRFSDQ